jgi:hypothetical protein
MNGEMYLYFCEYYVLVGYVKEKLMKLMPNSEIKKHGKVDSGLHEKILFRTPLTDMGKYDTCMQV